MQKRTREEWLDLVAQWRNSGKSRAAWCREHQIPKNTLTYWIQGNKAVNSHLPLTKKSFVELKNSKDSETQIELKFQEFKIILSKNFDADTLLKCVMVLRKSKC